MRIVLTNDDGIEAPGLLAARRALEGVGDVITVAPDRNRSGVGRSISFGRSLHVEEVEMADGVKGYACSGTPVDCVRLVALGLMDFEPDVVVSGVNHGENLGDDITYSGTVAGAMEGIVIGVPGIAVSLSINRPWHETVEESMPLDDGLHFERGGGFHRAPGEGGLQGFARGTYPQRQRAQPAPREAQGRAGYEAGTTILQGRARRGKGRRRAGRLRHLQQPPWPSRGGGDRLLRHRER